ncbi:hypothetical protein lerEdw1_002178 [Lerista edwardsae]|nr:hypothetical protein lerEdw1_002178 [Lerista edwardsae]
MSATHFNRGPAYGMSAEVKSKGYQHVIEEVFTRVLCKVEKMLGATRKLHMVHELCPKVLCRETLGLSPLDHVTLSLGDDKMSRIGAN